MDETTIGTAERPLDASFKQLKSELDLGPLSFPALFVFSSRIESQQISYPGISAHRGES